MKRSVLGFALAVALPVAAFAASGPFERLAGQWTGTGTIHMSDGSSETLRCRAAYDVVSGGNALQLAIRCAGQSYNFDLRSSARYAGGRISGVWSELTLNTGGQISGSARGNSIHIIASGQSFSATLTVVTSGGRQSVSIRAQPNSKVVGASMTLTRG